MANTTNLNLSKLAGTEKLKTFPSPYNDNMDAIDGAFGAGFGVSGKPSVNAELNSLGDGLAIIANGNTHAAITSGQFVYVRGHGTLSDGLYVATSNISANATLSGSNLTADSAGGLNTVYSLLNSNITNKNSLKIVKYSTESKSIQSITSDEIDDGYEKTFWFNGASQLSDYPTILTNKGATYYPFITIKRCGAVREIRINAFTNAGNPIVLFGGRIGTTIYWCANTIE